MICGEDWVEVAVYELKGVSGKDSVRSPEFQRLYADIQSGRVNVLAATALDRVTRSVKDFLTLFEFLQQHDVEFVSLKEQCDTSTAVGRFFATLLMGLAQLERETTSERTRDTTQARSERGLWNGGRILGYDPDPNNRSTLLVNDEEAAVVQAAFGLYLEKGSLKDTAAALNRRGYRTKSYTSRRGKVHLGSPFSLTAVQQLLKNRAYVGEKEIGKRQKQGKPQVVQAVWPAIIEKDLFEEVQQLMGANGQRRHNSAETLKHVHTLGGLLHCGLCGTATQGRSGTGRLGKVYFYYICTNKGCGLRVAAEEKIEGAVVERIGYLAQDEALFGRLIATTNQRLQHQEPMLLKQQRALQKKLENLKATAEKVFAEWSVLDHNEGRAFLTEKLGDLGQQRVDAERGLVEVESRLVQVRSQAITAAQVRAALAQMDEVYKTLKPHERRELMRLVLQRVEISAKEIVLEIKGNACTQASHQLLDGKSRFEGTNWLPEAPQNTNFVEWGHSAPEMGENTNFLGN